MAGCCMLFFLLRHLRSSLYTPASFCKAIKRDLHSSSFPFLTRRQLHRQLRRQEDVHDLHDLLSKRVVERIPKYNKCAVVGASPLLLHKGLGSNIDTHEAVFRVNNSPTTGYEEDVGSFTTARVFNVANTPTLHKVLLDMNQTGERLDFIFLKDSISAHIALSSMPNVPHFRFAVFSRDFIETARKKIFRRIGVPKHIRVKVKGAVHNLLVTTGFEIILVALRSCENVSLYGFGLSGARNSCMHYYDDHSTCERDKWKIIENTRHHFDVEPYLLLETAKKSSFTCVNAVAIAGNVTHGEMHLIKAERAISAHVRKDFFV